MATSNTDNAAAALVALASSRPALLLDVDGTLLDIARAPDRVHVPDGLRDTLRRLSAATGGACAFVSGRPVADLDRIFAPLELPAVGAHGAQLRLPGERVRSLAPPLPDMLRRDLAAVGAQARALVEDKGLSLALHFRDVPEREADLRRAAQAAIAACPDDQLVLLDGKAMIEVKRSGIDKGTGVAALMAEPPFRGRHPVFIGDDVTDVAVFEFLPRLGGTGFSVGRDDPHVAAIFGTPQDVRDSLAELAARL
jgi:trehalose 6-phosphate phosphatase